MEKMTVGEVAMRTGLPKYMGRYFTGGKLQELNLRRQVAKHVATETATPLRVDRLSTIQASLVAKNGRINPATLEVRGGKYRVNQKADGTLILRFSADR